MSSEMRKKSRSLLGKVLLKDKKDRINMRHLSIVDGINRG